MKTNRTKIIATVGPSCSDEQTLQSLVNTGVDCFRVNLSHGTIEEKSDFFDLIKKMSLPSGERPAILADLSGPKIRVSDLKKSLHLKVGDSIKLVTKRTVKILFRYLMESGFKLLTQVQKS